MNYPFPHTSPFPNSFITNEQRFFSYHQYLKSRFGHRIHKITVDGGFTCPNRDGTVAFGGCTYCNNEGFSPASNTYRPKIYLKPSTGIREQIDNSISPMRRRFKIDKFFVYFQAYSNTYAPVEQLKKMYDEALSHPDIIGLVIGTRPDCIDPAKLDLLESYTHDYYVSIEYGCESIYDRTLEWVNRAHTYQCFVDAVHATAERDIDVCGHIILGFPTETRDEMVAMADALSIIPLKFIKIHNLHIVEGTALAHIYKMQPFHVFDFDEYLELVTDFVERLSPEIAIERLYGDAPQAMMIAPTWMTTGSDMAKAVNQKLIERNSFQGIFSMNKHANVLKTETVNPQ